MADAGLGARPRGVRLTVVGCAAAYTRRPGRASSCYLVHAAGRAILLDLGQGAFAELEGYRSAETLDAVFVSHLHPDHLVDLIPMRHDLRYAFDPPASVALHAPPGLRARVDALLGEPGFLDGLPGPDLRPGVLEVGPFRVETRPVRHAEHSYGFRVALAGSDQAPGLVYSGDCGRPEDVAALLRPADTLLCEASWGALDEPRAPLHLTALQAADAAREGHAARLILTHVLDRHDPAGAIGRARERFDGEVLLAEPGLVVDVD